jgi:hypothetical protein
MFWWKFVPGITITVIWPNGEISDSTLTSSDPNDHYRPWLEENVGKQHWDWDWRHSVAYYNSQKEIAHQDPIQWGDAVLIKVRKKHAAAVTMIMLKWQ